MARPPVRAVALLLLFVLAHAYSPEHLKKQSLANVVPHSLTNCYGVTGSHYVDLSHLHGKIFTGFAKQENVTAIVQFCYAIWTAYGVTKYNLNPLVTNPHKMGHTLGYYQTTIGAEPSVVVNREGAIVVRNTANFVASYTNGDTGRPCFRHGRTATINIKCTDSFSNDGSRPAFWNIAANCTEAQMQYGGCLLNFEHVTSCTSEITMLAVCGTPISNQYIWWNWTDMTCWGFIILFIYLVLTIHTGPKMGANTVIVPLRTQSQELTGFAWLTTNLRTLVFGQKEMTAEEMGLRVDDPNFGKGHPLP